MTFVSLSLPLRPRTARKRLKPLFSSPVNGAITVVLFFLILWIGRPVLHWAVLDAVWTGTAQDCAASDAGACWAFVAEKLRFILFAFFPQNLQWRPAVATVAVLVLLACSAMPRFWSRRLIAVWIAALTAACLLVSGVIAPPIVSTNHWGGLPITVFVSIMGLGFAFPLAVLLALARRSRMRILRLLAVTYIEVLRAVPMIVVLYVAMLIVPMALPAGALVDKLLRAQIGITLFASAYLAEIIRAGLQALPAGQSDAACALGLTYWQTARLIILPQALRAVIPAIVNLSVGILLNTSLLAVIGIYDLLNAAKSSATDPQWLGFYTEAYVIVAAIYFAFSFCASRYSLWLERHLRAGGHH
ncbi:amino acid ABC transporter permease [Rhizobium sp. S-51]|uniref:Amino acid ABC transporter permease n=1 Tax=Rhizobium terricola TaxID=2728849 RepID=A0A7Y0B136_9HYPH|nr:amino acid ABC transporter permease [Rhizobium terricola]NML77063.1 amino acid ABC transporter permease [Rhizobium terricola]